jgi:hypothetical protein
MTKIKQLCSTCQGKGTVPRTAEDYLATNPLTKGILNTYPEKLCDACGGSRYVESEVKVVEASAS